MVTTIIRIEALTSIDPYPRYHGRTVDKPLPRGFWTVEPADIIGNAGSLFTFEETLDLLLGAHTVEYSPSNPGMVGTVSYFWGAKIYVNNQLVAESGEVCDYLPEGKHLKATFTVGEATPSTEPPPTEPSTKTVTLTGKTTTGIPAPDMTLTIWEGSTKLQTATFAAVPTGESRSIQYPDSRPGVHTIYGDMVLKNSVGEKTYTSNTVSYTVTPPRATRIDIAMPIIIIGQYPNQIYCPIQSAKLYDYAGKPINNKTVKFYNCGPSGTTNPVCNIIGSDTTSPGAVTFVRGGIAVTYTKKDGEAIFTGAIPAAYTIYRAQFLGDSEYDPSNMAEQSHSGWPFPVI